MNFVYMSVNIYHVYMYLCKQEDNTIIILKYYYNADWLDRAI